MFLLVVSLVIARPWGSTVASEDFNDGTGPFPTSTNGSYTTAYVDSGYMVTILEPASLTEITQLPWTSSAVGITADISFPDFAIGSLSAAGVMALSSSTEGYVFAVGTDRSFVLVKVLDPQHNGSRELQQIVGGTIPAEAGYPSTMRLDASSDGGRVNLVAWVNGVQVTTGSDPAGYGSFNRVGLYASADSAGAKMLFDNVVVTRS